jgi:hypothetical protein
VTTLDDLKRAIDDYSAADTSMYSSTDLQARKAHAWRTAFEWRENWRSRCHDITPQSIQWSAHCDEGDEGMALIREKLS